MSGARQRRQWLVGSASHNHLKSKDRAGSLWKSKTNAWESNLFGSCCEGASLKFAPARRDELRLKLTPPGSPPARSGSRRRFGRIVRGSTSHAREQPSERVEGDQRVDQIIPERSEE